MTLRWTSATDDGDIKQHVLHVNGEPVQNLGEVQYETRLGGVTRTDPREFDIRAQDMAGNIAPASNRVKVVPDVAGKTEADARAALEAAGFTVGRVIEESSASPPGSVIRQSADVADVGAAIELVLATLQEGRAAFRIQVASARRIVIGRERTLNVRVAVTEPARVSALLSLRRTAKRVKGWSMRWNERSVEAGATIVKLRLPKNLRRPGPYILRLRATSLSRGDVTTRTTRISVVRKRPARTARAPLEVVVVKTDEQEQPTLDLDERFKVMHSEEEAVFDVTTGTPTEVAIIVIDVDAEGGLELVRDLRAVYPDLRIVALASSKTAAAARRAGANPVLIKPVSDELLARVVERLAGG